MRAHGRKTDEGGNPFSGMDRYAISAPLRKEQFKYDMKKENLKKN